MNDLEKMAHLDLHIPTIQGVHVYIHCWFTTSRCEVTHFIKNLGYVLMVLNHSVLEIIGAYDSVMTSAWEPQCHCDIIMRTPRIMGKPRFSCSWGPKSPLTKIPLL